MYCIYRCEEKQLDDEIYTDMDLSENYTKYRCQLKFGKVPPNLKPNSENFVPPK